MSDYLKDLRQKVGHAPITIPHSVVIVMNQNGEILFEERADDGYFDFPGGAKEPGESGFEAAKRELFEETGLIADSLTLLKVYEGDITYYKYVNGDEIYGIDSVYVCERIMYCSSPLKAFFMRSMPGFRRA